MRRISVGVKPGHEQLFVHHLLHAAACDTPVDAADKEVVFVLLAYLPIVAHSQIIIQRFTAAIGEEHHALLIALADNAHVVIMHIRQIKRHKL